MMFPRIITFLFLIFTNLLFLGSSNPSHYDFQKCLIDQCELTNSATDNMYTPQNAKYASLTLSSNLRLRSTSSEKPDVVFTPFHASEIRAAILCSKKLGRQIAVRSGGHDYEGLSYLSKNPFVIVDMRNFRSVTVDEKEKTAWIQVGATLGQLYYTLSRKSKTLAFPAGVCPTVGVGGHFSGGGYGMMSRKHSIASDHIIDAKLINADGEVLDKKSMGDDLFWAIRGGGGSSFGIVLEYKVTLVTVPEIVTVFNVTRNLEEKATEIVYKWQHIADKIDENLLMRLFITPVNRTIEALFTSLYLGPVSDLLPLVVKEFPELGLVKEDCIEMSFIKSIQFFAGIDGQPREILRERSPPTTSKPFHYKAKSDFVTSPIPVKGLRDLWSFLLKEEGPRVEFSPQMEFSPYGGAMSKFSESETPFPHRKGNIFMIHYGVGWKSQNESIAHVDWIRGLHGFLEPYVSKSPRAAYINYRDLDIGRNNNEGNTSYEQASVWGLSYFKNNFKRLVRVKTKVDPSNFFRNEQSIPPLLI